MAPVEKSLFFVRKVIRKLSILLGLEPPISRSAISKEEIVQLVGKDNPTILDIGCNDGQHTLWFLDMFKNARVFSFEPDPRAIERYKAKVNDKRAQLFEFAISDSNGTVEFHSSGGQHPQDDWQLKHGWDQSGSIKKPKRHLDEHPWCKFDNTIQVPTKKLDSWLEEAQIELFDFIWVDVQGAEENLIRGGQESLRRTRYLYTEYSDDELYEGQINLKNIMKILPDFEVVTRYRKDVLLKNRLLP
jgi:2-O-methyltransferase